MASVTPEYLALQQAVIGRYSLERELGRGGMGIVFLARDVALDRSVAIKLLPPALAANPQLESRFLQEARTAARLSHPHIVPIHAVEQAAGLVYFVMGYIEGETLGERLRARGPLAPAEASRMIQEVAWALAYAHGHGLVHRDIKPDNILLERGTGRAVVTDFGIAAAVGNAGDVVGTPEYISPEQAQGQPVDGRSDLYSLGVTAYFAITGTHPFRADDVHALLAMHVTRAAPPLLAIAPGTPARLAAAVDRCLRKDADERFPSGETLAESVAATLEPQRQLPAPIRVWLRSARSARSAYMLWLFGGGPATTALVGAGLEGVVGGVAAVLAALVTYTAVPFVVHAGYRMLRLRRLLSQGYQLSDVRMATVEAARQRREELAFEFREPARPARIIRKVALGSFAAIPVGVAALFASPANDWIAAGTIVAGVVAVAGLVIGTVYPGKRITKDQAAEWRAKFWNSRFGEWFERQARRGLRDIGTAEGVYRPTEVAISLAAEAVFESLDREVRRGLEELPSVVARLQKDAQVMRGVVDDLAGALAALNDSPTASSRTLTAAAAGDALSRQQAELRRDLTERHAEAKQRLGAAVSALESLRLGLLRLKAGVGSRAELTADLASARALTQEVDRQAVAHKDVAALLRPRATPEPTPS